MAKIKHVMFLCAGNTCRSPFAERFAKWLKETKYNKELKDVYFDSGGIYHYYKTAQTKTIEYLESKDIHLKDFKTKKIDEELLQKQDLILGFEQKHHINKLKRKFKNAKDLNKKTFLLLEFVGEKDNLEIEDPFYLPRNEYNKILKRIEVGVIGAIEKIIKLNRDEE